MPAQPATKRSGSGTSTGLTPERKSRAIKDVIDVDSEREALACVDDADSPIVEKGSKGSKGSKGIQDE